MSTKRGVPPADTIAATVGIAVFDVVMTSSPGRDIQRPQGQHQGVGAAVDTHPVARAAIGGKLLFERADAVAKDQPSRPHDLVDRRQNVVPFGLVLGAVVPNRNGHAMARVEEYPIGDMQRRR